MLLTACSDGPDGPAVEPARRTVLVYMAANNSLGSNGYDEADLREMSQAAQAGALQGCNLMIFRAATDGTSTLQRMVDDGTLTLVATYDPTADGLTAVNIGRMRQVLADVRSHAPATSYGIMLWSHGAGWLENGIDDLAMPRPKSWGDDGFGARRMNIASLQQALEGQQLDFVWFDCCNMACIEVAYQLRKVTPYIVASTISTPSDGAPYDAILAPLLADKPLETALVDAAKASFAYYDALAGKQRTWAITVMRTQALPDIADATARIYAQTGQAIPDDYQPQRMWFDAGRCYYYDFDHYVKALATPEAYADWRQKIDRCVAYTASTPAYFDRAAIPANCGITTFVPVKGKSDFDIYNYRGLDWYADVACRLPLGSE